MDGSDQEDLRKLHQEVNQIVQQRFTLTTVAVGVFGVMIAWAFPKTLPAAGTPVPSFTYVACISLLLVLLVLFALHLSLKLFLRVLTAYLLESNLSRWEGHWATWRNEGKSYMGYSKPQTAVFVFLGLLTWSYPHLIGCAYQMQQDAHWMTVTNYVGGAYFLGTILFGMIYGMKGSEAVYRQYWSKILRESKEKSLPASSETSKS